jgi:oligoendopeptidase F
MMRDVDLRAWLSMTLAETASTFGENVLMNGILDDPSRTDRENSDNSRHRDRPWRGLFLGHIPVALRSFEKDFYQQRAEGPFSVSNVKNLMVRTQKTNSWRRA